MKECKHCKADFFSKRDSALFCSPKCRTYHHRQDTTTQASIERPVQHAVNRLWVELVALGATPEGRGVIIDGKKEFVESAAITINAQMAVTSNSNMDYEAPSFSLSIYIVLSDGRTASFNDLNQLRQPEGWAGFKTSREKHSRTAKPITNTKPPMWSAAA